jgi:PAS domain S-box-containing protein
MINFYRRALNKIDKLDIVQHRELLVSAIDQISLLDTVLDSIDAGILVCDDNNNLVIVNKFARRFFPVSYNEGLKIWEAFNDELLAVFIRETLSKRERITGREADIIHNEQKKLLSINVLPLVKDKKITGSLVYIEDITEKRKKEAQLRRTENLASLTTLAAGVAHEIKNPLGSISIHLQLLQKALLKNKNLEKIENYFYVIKEELDRLNGIVVDFLYAVRPLPLELREGNINELIEKIMEFVTPEMEQSGILCMLELGENVPKILLDERLIKQTLLNLVKNAQTAMPKGGVLTVSTNYTENEIKVSVCDTGIGIDTENMAKIFEPYFTTTETGTGLGLTQVYKIIRAHHGEITVDSAPGAGSDFRIILPVPQKETRMISYNEASGTEAKE